jgi:hypothetical protein
MCSIDDAKLFNDFMARLRAFEKTAQEQFVAVYEPILRQVVGHRLVPLGLSTALDPEDIIQQVFAKFFSKVLEGIELASSEDLLKLLVTMTNAQIIDEERKAHTVRRGKGKPPPRRSHLEDIVAPRSAPGE